MRIKIGPQTAAYRFTFDDGDPIAAYCASISGFSVVGMGDCYIDVEIHPLQLGILLREFRLVAMSEKGMSASEAKMYIKRVYRKTVGLPTGGAQNKNAH